MDSSCQMQLAELTWRSGRPWQARVQARPFPRNILSHHNYSAIIETIIVYLVIFAIGFEGPPAHKVRRKLVTPSHDMSINDSN